MLISPRENSAGSGTIRRAAPGVLGFLIAALIVHLAVPWEPFIPSFTERMHFFRERADRFSFLFIGSSRMRAHVNPRVVDRHLREEGLPHGSFNLGVDALNLIELNSIVEEVIRLRSPSLRYAVIEPVFSTNLAPENVTSQRSIYFHTLANTALEVRCNLTLPAMRPSVGRSLRAAGYHLANMGRLSSLALPAGLARSARLPVSLIRETMGHQAQDTLESKGLQEWRRKFLEEADELKKMMEGNRRLEEGERFDLPCQFDAVLDIAGKLRQAGIQPVFVHTPGFIWIEDSLSFEEYSREAGDPTPMLSYIGGHDELYDPELWYDHRHLNGEAAAVFSERLAADLARLIRSESGI